MQWSPPGWITATLSTWDYPEVQDGSAAAECIYIYVDCVALVYMHSACTPPSAMAAYSVLDPFQGVGAYL